MRSQTLFKFYCICIETVATISHILYESFKYFFFFLYSWLKEWKLRADREERNKQKDKKQEEGSNGGLLQKMLIFFYPSTSVVLLHVCFDCMVTLCI